MNVLGVHIGHDSCAAVVSDGHVVADAAEERFSRIKHDAGLPVGAIACCLEIAELELAAIDVVAVASEQEMWPLNELFDLYGGPHEQRRGSERAAVTARRLARGAPIRSPARRPLYARRYPLSRGTELVHVAHHLAHASSAYYTSPDAGRQLVVTLDGIGDGVSGAVWRGERGRLECLEQFGRSGSLGWFYGNVTEALGWMHGDGEGTTMALAALGDPETAIDALAPFHPRFDGGALSAPHRFEAIDTWHERGVHEWHSPEATAIAAEVSRYGREQIAAAAQRILEQQVLEIVYPWLEREETRTLSSAGGVFLNVKLNQRLRESGRIDRHHAYFNPGDAGLAAGAALHAYYASGEQPSMSSMSDPYLGPQYSEAQIAELLAERRLEATRRDDIPQFAAKLLADHQLIGWFQGRMESGPRALGSRSILADPTRTASKQRLDERVKFREPFRPYCPSVLAESASAFLERPQSAPYMITSFDARADRRSEIPAVVHVDGTVRPQTVERENNPRFHELIAQFGALTGEPLVLNTSFNVKGEPIVCHPRDAIRTFYDTALDCLIIGDMVLRKPS